MRSRFQYKPASNDEVSLQITSMADIFTIILVFLLKSFGSTQISPSAGLVLPTAVAESPQVQALKLEISRNSVLLENKPVTSLSEFQFPPQDLTGNHSSKSVSATLGTERERQKIISAANPTVALDSKILIIADQDTPYSTLKTVLASAAMTGYTDYKLVVLSKD